MAQTDLAQRMPQEVFTPHAQAIGAEDLDAILMDYALTTCSFLSGPPTPREPASLME